MAWDENENDETTGGLIRPKSPKQSLPSYKTGYGGTYSE
jgi:hypothetical protein